ncbi:MFS transporter [Xanthobacter agilis]|uniref:MHS family proline/betaine transporter-like MFS transporter n=1 Tax=Xanthobacter agilis TaxID=47492 RepID=A0ABU0L9R3_XANAG|nr:MFS transporter [Xanthobacter agilis]MDQ0503869.1 MHS family proline/betaine transporter-like MFS transporter [Xanthobacter agilis]
MSVTAAASPPADPARGCEHPRERGGRLSASAMAAAAMGNMLEWYDFAVYGFLATVFARNFFPDSSPSAGLISVFGVFAASFLMRPLGSIVFGHIGDRHGRRAAMLASALCMTVSTVAVGLLPTYAVAGVAAPALLLALRLVQGLCIGGEYMSSAVFLAEGAPSRWRGACAALATVGCNGGTLVGSGIGALTTQVLTPDQLDAWGWRLPFLLGLVLGGFTLVLRRTVPETPLGVEKGLPLVAAFRDGWRDILRASCFNFVVGLSFYLIFVYLATWQQQVDGFSPALALELNTISMLVVLVMAVAFAALSDLVGRKLVLGAGFLGLALFSWPLFQLMRSGDPTLALISQIAFSVLIATGGAMPVMLAEMFSRRTRCTSVGLSWNIAIGIGGGTAPMVAVLLVNATGNPLAPAGYLIGAATLAFLAVLSVPDRAGRPLD